VLAGGVTLAVAALAVPFAPFLASRLGIAATQPVAEFRSFDERGWLAGAALDVAAENPLLGTGLGTLPQALVTSSDLPYRPQPAHLVPLTIAAENGIPAALAFCLLLGGAMVTVISRTRSGRVGPGTAGTAIGLLVGIAVVSGFDYYPWVFAAGRTWFAVAIGAAIGLTGAPGPTANGHEAG
jgi:O-antigen ligase